MKDIFDLNSCVCCKEVWAHDNLIPISFGDKDVPYRHTLLFCPECANDFIHTFKRCDGDATQTEIQRFTLVPNNGRKSFYGKCYVEKNGDTSTLYSYNVKIMSITVSTREIIKFKDYNYSQTTKRHQRAFCEYYSITKEELDNAIERK